MEQENKPKKRKVLDNARRVSSALVTGTNEAELKKLSNSLHTKTGVDFSAYVNKEMMESVGELILFPKYILQLCLGTIALSACTFFLISTAWAYWNGFLISGTFITLFSLILGALNGIIMIPAVSVHRIKTDLSEIGDFVIDQTIRLLDDIETVADFSNHPEREWPKLTEIFQGVAYLIVLPSLLPVIAKKIPFIGRGIAWVVKRLFGGVIQSLCIVLDESLKRWAKTPDSTEENDNEKEDSLNKGYGINLTRAKDLINSLHSGIQGIVDAAVRISIFPLRMAYIISTIISLGILFSVFYLRGLF